MGSKVTTSARAESYSASYSYPTHSPSGKKVIPPEGPEDAEVVLVGESPARREMELGKPFVGRAGKVLNGVLARAGIDRSSVRLVNAVPVRAPGDRFSRHRQIDREWGEKLLQEELRRAVANGARLIVPLGENPLQMVCGDDLPRPPRWGETDGPNEKSRIGAWRGSLVPLDEIGSARLHSDTDLHRAVDPRTDPYAYALPSFHPAAVARRYQWHRQALDDLKRARAFLDDRWPWPKPRQWTIGPPSREWVDQIRHHEKLVGLDSEHQPTNIVALVSEEEVYAFTWRSEYLELLAPLLEDESVLVVAHNVAHDWTFMRQLGFDAHTRWVDTGGFAHVLCNALPRSLSPGLSARFTGYPYHKWLVEQDPVRYCGWDAVVCYDAYWEALDEVMAKDQLHVVEHDHKLLRSCLAMQWRGVKVDEQARSDAEHDAAGRVGNAEAELKRLAEPVVREKLAKFNKPHLFKQVKQCKCCGGGKTKREQCWSCAGFSEAPRKSELEELAEKRGVELEAEKPLKADLENALLEPCEACEGEGSIESWLDWKWDGPALNDVLYRGFGIRPRSYKGRETRRADQLAPVVESGEPEQSEIVQVYLDLTEAQSELQEMRQLAPDYDGRLHAQFDPWGTGSGRVASRASLLQQGRNMQNIPRKYRNVLVADEGAVLFAPDYDQIELRVIAVLSGEEQLKRWLEEPLDWPDSPRHGTVDPHSQLQKLFHENGVMLSRDQTKRMAYAGSYGAEAPQLAIELSKDAHSKGKGVRVDERETEKLLRLFYDLLPGIRRWQMEDSKSVVDKRYVESLTGRKRWWLGYITRNTPAYKVRPTDYVVQEFDKRGKRYAQILNRKIQKEVWSFQPQDVAAWVLALGLDRLHSRAAEAGIEIDCYDPNAKYGPLLHVHDEVVLQVRASQAEAARELITDALSLEQWGVTFAADAGQPARNWRDAKGE